MVRVARWLGACSLSLATCPAQGPQFVLSPTPALAAQTFDRALAADVISSLFGSTTLLLRNRDVDLGVGAALVGQLGCRRRSAEGGGRRRGGGTSEPGADRALRSGRMNRVPYAAFAEGAVVDGEDFPIDYP
ncbi:MAG: hypothetical protein KAI24_18690 [Planctomycetes bacterium]|nr:hypothetical protein [Planctomycetota bacterium]